MISGDRASERLEPNRSTPDRSADAGLRRGACLPQVFAHLWAERDRALRARPGAVRQRSTLARAPAPCHRAAAAAKRIRRPLAEWMDRQPLAWPQKAIAIDRKSVV